MRPLFKNNAASTVLNAPLTVGGGSITVPFGQGARFPLPVAGESYFLATLIQETIGIESAWEIVKVTSRLGDVLAVTRGQEGTTPLEWPAGTKIQHRVTAAQVSDLAQGYFEYDGVLKTAGFTAQVGHHYIVNTASGGFTMLLPAAPVLGDQIKVTDLNGTFSGNPDDVRSLTLGRNGNRIYGIEANMNLNIPGFSGVLMYVGTLGWYFV